MSIGQFQGGVYTNEYVGVGCELESGWEFYTAEELQDLPGEITEMMDGSELGEAMKDVEMFIDMQADNVDELTTMNVTYKKLTVQQRLAYVIMDEEEIMDVMLENKDTLIESYEQAGVEVNDITRQKVNYLGEEHTALHMSAISDEVEYYTLQILECKKGEYSVTITVGSYLEDKTEDLLTKFYAL